MSKFDRNRIKDGWEKLCTNKQTNRHYENNGHLAVNQLLWFLSVASHGYWVCPCYRVFLKETWLHIGSLFFAKTKVLRAIYTVWSSVNMNIWARVCMHGYASSSLDLSTLACCSFIVRQFCRQQLLIIPCHHWWCFVPAYIAIYH